MAELFDIVTYDTIKVLDTLNIPETYQNIAELATPGREAGKYLVGFSLTWSLASTNKSVYIQFRLNDSDWTELRSEPKDLTNSVPVYYAFPKDLLGGVMTLDFQARKEDDLSGQFDIPFLDLFIQRVG